jgi:hypothetical protein
MEQSDYEQYAMQEQMQQNNRDFQQTMNAPQLFEQVQQNQAIMVQETNPKRVIENIMLVLKGVEKMPDGTEVQKYKPKMNDRGLDAVNFWLQGLINQNIILSHIEATNINALMQQIGDDFVDKLFLNRRLWGITDSSNLDDINDIVLVNIFFAMKRAEGQGEKNFLSKISIENISGGNRLPSMKKESFWSKFKI